MIMGMARAFFDRLGTLQVRDQKNSCGAFILKISVFFFYVPKNEKRLKPRLDVMTSTRVQISFVPGVSVKNVLRLRHVRKLFLKHDSLNHVQARSRDFDMSRDIEKLSKALEGRRGQKNQSRLFF